MSTLKYILNRIALEAEALFLIPLLFHNAVGLPLTIVLIVALIAVRVVFRQRRRARARLYAERSARDRPVGGPGRDRR